MSCKLQDQSDAESSDSEAGSVAQEGERTPTKRRIAGSSLGWVWAHCGKAYKFFSLAGIMGLGIDLSFFKFFAKVLVFVLAVME